MPSSLRAVASWQWYSPRLEALERFCALNTDKANRRNSSRDVRDLTRR